MEMKSVATLAVVGLSASAAMAQPGGTINDNNMRFTIGAAPVSGTAGGVPSGDLFANQPVAAGAANPDHAFETWWWFREAGGTRELAMNSSGGGAVSSFANNRGSMTQFYANFRADLAFEVISTGPGQGLLRSTLTITNLTASALEISLFNYADLDLNDTAANDRAVLSAPNLMRISDSTGPYVAEFSGVGADAYQVGSWPSLRSLLINAGVDNFNGTGLPFGGAGGGDFTAGFQWNVSIDAGFSRSVVSTISFVPTPGAAALLGLGVLAAGRRRRA